MKKWMRIVLALFLMQLSCVVFAQTYRIGVLLPLSGIKAEKGIPLRNAVELFVEQFNAANPKTQLELVVRDDFDDPRRAQVIAAEMVKDQSLLAVVGHYYSPMALATAKIFSDAHIPFISPNVSSQDFLEKSKWMFMMNLSDELQGSFMATYIKEVLKKDEVLLIHNDGVFGVAMRDAFLKKAARIGLSVPKVLQVPRSGEFSPHWAASNLPDAVENRKFGVVVALTNPESGLALLPQLRDHGIVVPVMAANTWADNKFMTDIDEKYTKDVYVTSAFLWEIANQKAAKFSRAYHQKFGGQPTVPAAMAFDAAFLLAQAIQSLEQSKISPSRTNVRDFLTDIDWHHALEGVSGMLFFNKTQDKTSEYVEKYLTEQASAGAKVSVVQALKREDENRALLRDVYVSVMKDGRFKAAMVQLVRPREEYVLKQLSERIGKGFILLTDKTPYHIVDVVFVGVDVIRINDVNIKDMLWETDVFMWFKWSGDRLGVSEIEKIGVINALKEQSTILKEDLSRPIKYRAYRKHLTLEAPYDLAAFPFDEQILPLSIAHNNKNSTHVMLVVDSRHMEKTPITDIKPREWDYLGRNMFSDLYRYESTFGDPDYRMGTGYKSPIYFSTVNLEVGVKRILKPYLYTFFLPLIILLGIILVILWVPLDQFTPRINASISGLVGILVYHMAQKSTFPKVGYTMISDYYFLLAYAFVVSMIICIIFTQSLMSKGQKDLAKRWNDRFSVGALSLSIGLFGLLTLYAIYFDQAMLFSH